VRALVEELLRAPRRRFVSRRELDAPAQHGVYAILGPRGRVHHVGRTTRAKEGIRQRLLDHIGGRSSFLRLHLCGEPARLLEGFRYSYVVIESDRLRALLEHLAVGTLCPAHLGLSRPRKV